MNDRELLELAARGKPKRERHGMNKTTEHAAWVQMKQRCLNPNKKEYKHYGGRGITICDKWMNSFIAFFEDVGCRPSPKHSIDRIDVNGNYEPGNVRWATQQQQVENTRTVRMVSINGKTQSISAWERDMGLPKGMVRSREVRGWSLEDAIITPSIPGQKKVTKVSRDYSRQGRDWHGRYKAAEIGKSLQEQPQ